MKNKDQPKQVRYMYTYDSKLPYQRPDLIEVIEIEIDSIYTDLK